MEVIGRAVLSASESDGGLAARFEDVIRRVGSLCAGAVRLTRNQQDAADLVQYTIPHTYAGFGTFPEGTNPMAWLYRITHNTWIALRAGGFRSSKDYHITNRVRVGGWRCSDEPTHSWETKREDADRRRARRCLTLRRSLASC
jgi:DNA-directed RNA polymerase specialized sigma24 family protein